MVRRRPTRDAFGPCDGSVATRCDDYIDVVRAAITVVRSHGAAIIDVMEDDMNDGLIDRAAGTLVGLAVGDALGAPYEFQTPGPIDPQMIGGGLGPWEPGEWTDDTQQSICVAQAACDDDFEVLAVGRRLLAWFADDPRDVGAQTSLVLSSVSTERELTARAAEAHAQRPHSTAGNGSLMRTGPVALAYLGDDEAIAT